MALLGEIADDHHADYAISIYHGIRDPKLAVARDLFDYGCMGSGQVPILQAKVKDRQCWRYYQFEDLGMFHPSCKLSGEFHLARDMFLVRLPAVNS